MQCCVGRKRLRRRMPQELARRPSAAIWCIPRSEVQVTICIQPHLSVGNAVEDKAEADLNGSSESVVCEKEPVGSLNLTQMFVGLLYACFWKV